MKTIGIDLAAQDKKTAMCTVRWKSGVACVAPPRVGASGEISDKTLVDALTSGGWVGVDSPFGWPATFVDAVSGHARRDPWPDVRPELLRYRLTDRIVRDELTLSPLSVSSDLIGVTAWRCARLLTLARAGRKAADRAGGDRIVEVYPGAALRRWGLDRRGYKGSGGATKKKEQRSRRALLVETIEKQATWLSWRGDARERCVENDDALDAFLCALIARAAAIGLTGWPRTRAQWRAARAEGWIHLPSDDSLGKLAGRRAMAPPSP